MTREGKPLNGEKTHPLSPFALKVLAQIAAAPMPCQEINPGVRDRFGREKLTEIVMLPSPYKAHKGGNCPFEKITAAGLRALGKPESEKQK